MAWACMAASGVGSLIFLVGSNRMNSEVYKNMLSANSQRIESNFIMQQGNDPECTTNTTKAFIREEKWKVLDWPS